MSASGAEHKHIYLYLIINKATIILCIKLDLEPDVSRTDSDWISEQMFKNMQMLWGELTLHSFIFSNCFILVWVEVGPEPGHWV